MRRIALASLLVALASPALAQTAPVATPAPLVTKGPYLSSPFTLTSSSGFYVGIGTSAAVAASNVSGNVITIPGLTGGNVSAAGGTIDVDFGYIWGHCILGTWCQVEIDGKYTNIDGNTAVGNIAYRWGITEEFDIGADVIQTILAAFPSLSNPFPTFSPTGLLPANVAVATTPRGYFGVINGDYLVSGNVGQSGGQTWIDAPGVTTGFRWQTLGSTGKPNGGSLKVYADVMWGTKALNISNVFGAGGGPIVTQPNAALNTMYVVGLHYDFGI
jgi:hypothetical protein